MSKRYAHMQRELNRVLAQHDAANRCTFCKRNLAEVSVIIEDFLLDGKFCSDACLEQYRTQGSR